MCNLTLRFSLQMKYIYYFGENRISELQLQRPYYVASFQAGELVHRGMSKEEIFQGEKLGICSCEFYLLANPPPPKKNWALKLFQSSMGCEMVLSCFSFYVDNLLSKPICFLLNIPPSIILVDCSLHIWIFFVSSYRISLWNKFEKMPTSHSVHRTGFNLILSKVQSLIVKVLKLTSENNGFCFS